MIHTILNPTYDYSALEPYFDAATMQIHHQKHHQTYADKLNLTLETINELQDLTLEQLLIKDFTNYELRITNSVKNFSGGVHNHNLFWKMLSPNFDQPVPANLESQLTKYFDSVDNFKTQFADSAAKLFGSGWTWLVRDADKDLKILNLPNQDSPLSLGLSPLLGLDVWEHAYYLKYQNKRVDYVTAFWHVVNWEFVNSQG